ncbi:xanthine dehydrogenase family protein molybdopterin-binding subunit [Roseivivax isoporae]|uniref:Aldehyde oxidase n=1 Tax=Roseivivax isoporae LMG 25204 TaxID=1449351 RepID=X7FE97_9RHOB|nr:molybdopterin cofactor-binding domain-containing protein [Roseivivax isoporae]ETX30359.1 aldehyde oxidase [Roseivivax isoporae LMG 25204]
MRPRDLSRREFLQAAAAAGVAASVVPLDQALGAMQGGTVTQPPGWIEGGRVRFRRDGIPKVAGEKVFAIDVRARDMPGWPDTQSHGLFLRVARADRVFEGIDLSVLDEGLAPDVAVTAGTLARDGVSMPEEDFYGALLLPAGETPVFLGQPVAVLIYHDYARFRLAKRRLQFTEDAIRYGAETGYLPRDPYGGARFVRVGGPTPDAPDDFSPLKDATVFARVANRSTEWPEGAAEGDPDQQALHHAARIRAELEAPPADWAVYRRQYRSQYVDPAALETDNGNAWYDGDTGQLHVVTGTQSPYTNADHIIDMVRNSRFDFAALSFHPGYTVGYGQKEHHSFPYYVAMAALYGDGRPVRLALDRWEHFQSAIKRHPFDIDTTIAVDRETGLFTSLAADLVGDGGGRKNFSPSVGQVSASALQSIYYFPKSDLAVTMNASRAPTAGSMRGYGTLQSMVTTEMLVDEIAGDLGIDAIDLRRRNVLRAGMKNTQGAIPGGAIRADELLQAAADDPIWRNRARRKAEWEAAHPGHLYGVGFAAVHKDYGTGAEAALVQMEVAPDGRIRMRHVVSEIGCGATTAQMLIPAEHLGRPADDVEFAAVDWPSLPLTSNNEPYTMSQEEQDRRAQDPHWVPRITSPRSASNSAYYQSHATREAARLLFELGLWKAAVSIWTEGIGGGQAAPLVLRRENAEWRDGLLVCGGLEPLSLERLADRAHRRGEITGVTIHTFNRWAWTEAEFDVDGARLRAPIDALSVQWGRGASQARRARMTDAGYAFVPRTSVSYPPVQRNNAAVVYYAPNAALVELSVNGGTGEVTLLSHRSWMECGTQIVPELVSGQLQGGIAMGIGHALFEDMPRYEDGPGNGTWNFNRYRLPRASDVAVWSQTGTVLPPLSDTDPPKGIAEVVMIPIVAAIANAVHHATGHRFYDYPLTSERIQQVLT